MQINEISRPHCDECGRYYGGIEVGVAYVFNFKVVKLCDLCNEKFTNFFTRRANDRLKQLKIEEAKDGKSK